MPVLLQISTHSYQFTLVCLQTYLHVHMYVDTGVHVCNLFTCGGLYKTWITDIQWFNHFKRKIFIFLSQTIQWDKMLDIFNRTLRGRFNKISGILTISIDSIHPFLHAKRRLVHN